MHVIIILYNSNYNSVFDINYHMIFCTKYRREVINDEISNRLKEIFEKIILGSLNFCLGYFFWIFYKISALVNILYLENYYLFINKINSKKIFL